MLFIILGLVIIGVTFYFHTHDEQVDVAKKTVKQFAHDAAPAVRTVQTAAERAKGDFHSHRTEARLEKLTRELEDLKAAEKANKKDSKSGSTAQLLPRSKREV